MASFFNTATLRYNGQTRLSNTTVGEIVEVLSATKTPVRGTYTRGEEMTFAVSVQNAGTAAFPDLVLTDDLGAFTVGENVYTPLTYLPDSVRVFVNGTPRTDTPNVTAGPPLVIGPIEVPADSDVMVLYEAVVNEYAPLDEGAQVSNTVTMNATGLTAPVTAEAQITASDEPELNISKSVSPAVVAENGTLTYTFLVENEGNTAVTEEAGVQIEDTFDPPLSNLSVTYNGAGFGGDNYTYDPTTGAFSTTPGAITVPAATYTRDENDGAVRIAPGTATVTVTGTV